MIDLHSHILPGIDDGAADLSVSLEMARMAVADGITAMACTPHIIPGLYENEAAAIKSAVKRLQRELEREGIALRLFAGADIHIAPDLASKLAEQRVPTLNGSRYFLFEPPHHVVPPKVEELAERLINAGFVPVLTHPERLTWIKARYDLIEKLNDLGCLIQITAESVSGGFGKSPLYYAERLLDEGRVDILATDAHNIAQRPPTLSRARDSVAARLGEREALAMVETRPAAILRDWTLVPAARTTGKPAAPARPATGGLIGRLLRGQRP